MPKLSQHRGADRTFILKERALSNIERLTHTEATSGIILLFAAAIALIWANSSYGESYIALWHTPLSLALGSFSISWSLHFWVNDVAMTFFFLVAGLEIRREIHEGALSDIRQATLPIIAAIGGVILPAILYSLLNADPTRLHGWAVPTATDIAFAIGVLALLGRSIPANVRIILLSLAIIDDIIAVLIIALFYSDNIAFYWLIFTAFGVVLILIFHWIGLNMAILYVLPAAIIWISLMKTGIHPSLAGVILGMMTPVFAARSTVAPVKRVHDAILAINQGAEGEKLTTALKNIRIGQRDMVAPITRIQMVLHPWVAYLIMPVFALANAGIVFSGLDLLQHGGFFILGGVSLGLFLGKPLGIILASYLAVKLGLCRLPPDVRWQDMLLIGMLAGIGFTMAIFVSMLAFNNSDQLAAAKTGVLVGSAFSALCGLAYGIVYRKQSH